MLETISRFVLRHRVATLVLTGLFIALSVATILRGGRLSSGGFLHTEAERTTHLVEGIAGDKADTTFVVVMSGKGEDKPSQEALQAEMTATLAPLTSDSRVAKITTPESAPAMVASSMVNAQEGVRVAYITLHGDFPEALASYPEVRERLASDNVVITCTGRLPFMHDMNETLEHDLVRAELIALPLALLVLVLVFRTVVAATLPVGVGALAVLGGIGVVLGLSRVTDVAMYAVNVCSLIGLGVSIDYSLFLVSRYREELANGRPKDEAIVHAVRTAGKTIAFSGVAVCAGLAGLFFFTGSYLFAMGIAGVVVVALAVLFALTFLPALLSVLGDKIAFGRLARRHKKPTPSVHTGFWARIARAVMRRPLAFGLPALGLLLALAVPFAHLRLAAADVRVLDRDVEARRGYELLRAKLPELSQDRVTIAVQFPSGPALTEERILALHDFSERVKQMPNVTGVDSLFSSGAIARDRLPGYLLDPPPLFATSIEEGKALTVGDRVVVLYARTDATSDTEAARNIVRALRSDRHVADGELSVGGGAARDVDATAYVKERAPLAVGFVVVVTLFMLFVLLRSVILPIKAVLMNFLSMTGSFGALVFIFQDGHLGVTEPRPLEPTLPVLLFCVLFGLSMDYEVLLLSRIREAHLRTGDNTEAVAEGLEKTASLITSAAGIMVAVFLAFAFAGVVMIQAVGVGMALAVTLDATVVRTILVPATMRLMGRWNWWCPKLPRLFGGQSDGGSHDDRATLHDAKSNA